MQLSARPRSSNPKQVAYLTIAALVIIAVATALLLRDEPGSTQASLESAPAVVEPIEDSDLSRIMLTEQAAGRLDIQTDTVRTEKVNGAARLVVPYAAVYYAPTGEAWVYTNPEPFVYVRHPIEVDRIESDKAYLSGGPPADSAVVTVGVPELYGTEFEIGR